MKTFVTAVVIGVAIEAALVAALISGGIGPCGPASPVSVFVLFLHTPGVSLMNAAHIREPASLWLVPALYALAWSALLFLILGGRRTSADSAAF